MHPSNLSSEALEAAARALREAAATNCYIPPLRERCPQLDAAGAYAIQRINTQARLQDGRRVIGAKVGLTSRAVQAQLGVDSPDFGVLFDDMGWGDGEAVPWRSLHQPKVEAEIAFVLGRDLAQERPGHAEVLRAIDHALPAVEIVGSRIAGWDIGLVDTIADNASASAYVLGATPRSLREVDLRLCGMAMERRGEPVSTGAGLACLGHPLNAVVWLARTLGALGAPLRAGDLVLSGALGPMVPVQPGDVFDVRINRLGSVKAVFGREEVR